jgi:hypothetical protein
MYRVIGSSGNLSNIYKKKATQINKPTKRNNKKKIKKIDPSLFRLSNNLMLT